MCLIFVSIARGWVNRLYNSHFVVLVTTVLSHDGDGVVSGGIVCMQNLLQIEQLRCCSQVELVVHPPFSLTAVASKRTQSLFPNKNDHSAIYI